MQQGSNAPAKGLGSADKIGAGANAGAASATAQASATAHLTDEQILDLPPLAPEAADGVVTQVFPASSRAAGPKGGPQDFAPDDEENPRVPAENASAENPSYSKPS